MEKLSQSRRQFIAITGLLLASGGLLFRYLTPRTVGKRQVLASCASVDVPYNGALVFQEQRIALLRGQSGLFAISLVCTHLGCTVVVSGSEISCPCHGSVFDREGRVVKGPADKPLTRLSVNENGGVIEVTEG